MRFNPSKTNVLILGIIITAGIILSGVKLHERGLRKDLELYSLFLQRDASSFNRGLDQLTSISRQLATNPLLISALNRIEQQKRPTDITGRIIDKFLESTALIKNVSSAYLMDMHGNCVYSSVPSFVGKNYGFRPYFKAALADKPILYTAVGVTSKKLGIYYASPVKTASRTVGVVVVKILPSFFNIAPFSAAFVNQSPKQSDLRIGLLTDTGIILNLNGHPLYSPAPLSQAQIRELRNSRQFPPDQIKSFDFPPDTLSRISSQAMIEVKDKNGTPFLIFQSPLHFGRLFLVHVAREDWLRSAFHPSLSLYKFFLTVAAALLFLLLALLYFMYIRHRGFVATSRHLERANRQRIADQERYQTIISNSPVGFIMRSKEEGRVVYVNPSLCKLLGRTEEEVLANGLEAYISEAGFQCFGAEPGKTSSGVIETEITRSDGSRRNIIIHAFCFEDQINNTTYCCGFITDITEQKEQDIKLKLFSQIIEQLTSGVVITDTAGTILYTNPFFSQLTGYTAEEVQGRNPTILSSGETTRETYKDLWKTVLSGKTWRGVLKNRKKDGSVYDEGITVYPVRDVNGRITRLCAIKNDITRRLALERQLSAQASQFDIIADHVPIGLARVVDHRFHWTSSHGAAMFGYTRKEMEQLQTSDLFTDEDTFVRIRDTAQESLTECRYYSEEEVQMRRKDGTLLWCRLVGKLIDHDAPELGAVWLALDIEQERKEKKILENGRDQARQANKAKSSFLANMSHEIRTPLSSIIGMGNLLTETSLDDEQRHLLGNISSSSAFLLRLINDILDFSKIEAGKLQLDPNPFNLQTCLADVAGTMHSMVVEKGLNFSRNLADNLPECVIADEFRLKQILLNLLSNAMKFTENGSIGMDVSASERAEDKQLQLFFRITDTGVGIKPEHQKLIFETFTQADSSITRNFGGTGLGLAISSQLCKMMGGEISVESTPGQGSCFSFSIACSTPSTSEQEILLKRDETLLQPLPRLKILLVDDNSSNRFLARTILTGKDDHQVTEADSGFEALRQLGLNYFDLILMDVRMPLMDGITATAIIRDCENRRQKPKLERLSDDIWQQLCLRIRDVHIPIIALTADAMTEDKIACLKAGMDGYLSKPFSRDELIEVIKTVIPQEPGLNMNINESHDSKTNFNKTEHNSTMKDICEEVSAHLKKTYGLTGKDLDKMCRLSAETLVQSLEKAEQALAASDMETLSAAAHKAKGSLLALGLETDSELARQIETGAKTGVQQDYHSVLSRLQNHLEPLIQQFIP